MKPKYTPDHPVLTPQTVDIYLSHKSILAALISNAGVLRGELLDIGCGNQPYKALFSAPPFGVTHYTGCDIANPLYQAAEMIWDGRQIPAPDQQFDCVIATEIYEHCPDYAPILREVLRVLKPGGYHFLTVPFLWPLHDVPGDYFRYSPYAIQKDMQSAGFCELTLGALGGWDSALAQMLGLWSRRRPFGRAIYRRIASSLAYFAIRYLERLDQPSHEFKNQSMPTGVWCVGRKPVE
jgi:SAM-dependent methyltransferase